MELLEETGGFAFTVQDVVDRSKLSLRSFYQTFASKDDLLLALFEECVASAAEWQRGRMASTTTPIEQIRGVPHQPLDRQAEPGGGACALSVYNLTLSATRPSDLAHALEPQLRCCTRRSSAGSPRGRCVTTSIAGRLAEILLHTGNAAVHTTILQTGNESPADVWAVLPRAASSRRAGLSTLSTPSMSPLVSP